MINDNASPSSGTPRQPWSHRRRIFLCSLLTASVLAIPAISGTESRAIVLVQHGDREHCEKSYVRMLEGECMGGRYIVQWESRCADCGGLCGTWMTDEGPC
jgi:hypothetical protein